MPPLLVLAICTAFVLFLLRLEKQAAPETSLALWIPTIWMLIIASRPLVQWFNYVGPGGVTLDNDSGSPVDRTVLIILAAAAIAVLSRRRIDWGNFVRQQKWLLLLLAFMFLSTFWSDITLTALKRWSRELIVPIMALVVLSEVNPRLALESIFRRTAYVLLPFSIVLIKYFPWLGVRYGKYSGTLMWVGVGGQKNILGRLCAIAILFLFFALYRYRRNHTLGREAKSQAWADVFILLLGVYLLNGSASSTSVVSLLLGGVVFIGLIFLRRLKLRVPQFALLALAIALMSFGVATPFLGGSNVASLTGSLGRDQTLTGRTEVWADILPARAQHSMLGYGLGSFWTDARRAFYDIPTAHNGYLDVLLELGEVGLAIYAVWMLSCTRLMHRALTQDYEWSSLGLSFLFMGLLYNTSESSLNTLTEQMTAVVVFASFVISTQVVSLANQVKSSDAPVSKWKDYQSSLTPWTAAAKTKTWHEV